MKVLIVKKFKKSNKYVKISNEDLLYETEFDDKELNLIDINDKEKDIREISTFIVRVSYTPSDLIVLI
jgi:hypothetical protein